MILLFLTESLWFIVPELRVWHDKLLHDEADRLRLIRRDARPFRHIAVIIPEDTVFSKRISSAVPCKTPATLKNSLLQHTAPFFVKNDLRFDGF